MNPTVEVSLVEILNRLEGKIDSLDKKIEVKIDALDKKIEVKIDALDKKVDGVEEKLEAKIDALEEKFDKKFEHLSNEVNKVKVDVATIKEGQTYLKQNLSGVETRLNTLIAVAFTGLLGAIAKLVFLK